MRNESDTHRVAVVAMPRARLFELATAVEVFGVDRRDLTPAWYDFTLAATGPTTALGPGLLTGPGTPGLDALARADTVVVPACDDVHDDPPTDLTAALRRAHAGGARIVAICSGAFVLAAAGLLDGRQATTHWMHAEELAARYPRVRVDAAPLYLEDGGIWTSAGSAAGLDLCLELVRRDLGAAVANEVARRVVTPPHRSGDQAQYTRPHPSPARPHADAAVHDWVRANLATATVAGMAGHAGVSQRTLARRFEAATGTSPQHWLQRERLQAAQELLETTPMTLAHIARTTGHGTAANLRARFTRRFGVPPSEYRRTFHA